MPVRLQGMQDFQYNVNTVSQFLRGHDAALCLWHACICTSMRSPDCNQFQDRVHCTLAQDPHEHLYCHSMPVIFVVSITWHPKPTPLK